MSLIYEKRNHIAYLTINRPEAHNALDPDTILALAEAWEAYAADPELRCAIITGSGDRTFCAGADLGKLIPLFTGMKQPETETEQKIRQDPMLSMRAILRDYQLDKPLIAAINGDAIAGGMELLYATDIRVAAETARFGLQEVKWAVFPLGGSTIKLPRQIPYAKAMELLLTGDLISAQEALNYGLINQVKPANQVLEQAERYAHKIIKNGPLAIKAVKQSVYGGIGENLRDGLAREMELAIPVFMSQDAQEGPKAFKEKREPHYQGK